MIWRQKTFKISQHAKGSSTLQHFYFVGSLQQLYSIIVLQYQQLQCNVSFFRWFCYNIETSRNQYNNLYSFSSRQNENLHHIPNICHSFFRYMHQEKDMLTLRASVTHKNLPHIPNMSNSIFSVPSFTKKKHINPITLCKLHTRKGVLWQRLKTQMLHFIRVFTVCSDPINTDWSLTYR